MKLLVIADDIPRPDEASGDLRLFALLRLLAQAHEVRLCLSNPAAIAQAPGDAKQRLIDAGIFLGDVNVQQMLKHFKPDVVWFEFYHQARLDYLRLIDRYCPTAHLLIDSVDVHFNRLDARAGLTGRPEDITKARDIRARELAAYAKADMVIAVSHDDRELLRRELPNVAVEVVPNIHALSPFPDLSKRRYGELVFVGGFKHHPNVDAMQYFCRDVLPLIAREKPEVQLKIIGSNPPAEILTLASKHVEVVGYVPETAPYLETAYISVAPLRYGGGMKGKVGEAMSHGLPVVTTSFGAEGFGLEPSRDFLLGDTPGDFAAQVITLLDDPDLYNRVARSGYEFIQKHYSVPAVEQILKSSLGRLARLPRRKIPPMRRVMAHAHNLYARHLAWRLSRQ